MQRGTAATQLNNVCQSETENSYLTLVHCSIVGLTVLEFTEFSFTAMLTAGVFFYVQVMWHAM
jgi:hypothetical protein